MKIGPYTLPNNILLAPMAGVTDRPFRQLCRRLGAGFVTSEMVSSNPKLRQSRETLLRSNHEGEPTPRSVQIVGGEARMMADAARYNVDKGADIIDINMGCPAKKVCNQDAGSALLRDEEKVADIIAAVVNAVNVPVTLKIRTGWDRSFKNGVKVAKMAESLGIQALAVHGRTRADKYQGDAEYETIAAIKSEVNIPVIANGDINDPQKAREVLEITKADAVMLGRVAQGRPWVFREFQHYLSTGEYLSAPGEKEIVAIMLAHCKNLYEFYGEYQGMLIARRHVGWYLKTLPEGDQYRRQFNVLDSALAQCDMIGQMLLE